MVGEMKNADRYWQDHYFFMHVNEKSVGGLANAFYSLWGILHKFQTKNVEHSTKCWLLKFSCNLLFYVAGKELKKPPPKALLFEKKLEHLLV